MGASKHIKLALIDKDISQKEFSAIIDKPIQSVYNQLNRDTWKYADVEKIADKIGCDVVLIDRKTGKIY